MKKERKMKKMIQTQNPLRFPRFTVVVVTFFVKILDDFHDYVSQKTAKVPQLQRSSQVADVPVVQVVMVPQVRCGCERPCDHAATSSSLSTWRCLRFSSPAESWTSCCTTETGTQLSADVYGGGDGAF